MNIICIAAEIRCARNRHRSLFQHDRDCFWASAWNEGWKRKLPTPHRQNVCPRRCEAPLLQVVFEVADATKRSYSDESFDVIYSRDTILHIEDKKSLFAKFFVRNRINYSISWFLPLCDFPYSVGWSLAENSSFPTIAVRTVSGRTCTASTSTSEDTTSYRLNSMER